MYILISLFILLIAFTSIYVFSFFKDNDKRIRTFILKIVCAFLFTLIGIIAYIITESKTVHQLIILIGLILCMLGDILLGLRRITKFHDGFFLIGTSVFLVVHVTYDIALFINFNQNFFIQNVVAIAYWVLIVLITKSTKVNFRSFQIICYIYMMSSAFMLSIATINLFMEFNMYNTIMFIGILFFVLSDVLLCYTYFHEKIKESFLIKLISSYTYFLGQGIIGICILLAI